MTANPNHAESCVNLGNVFQDLEQYEQALGYYERALKIRPDYADAFNNRGLALKELGRYDEAIAACASTLRQYGPSLRYSEATRALYEAAF